MAGLLCLLSSLYLHYSRMSSTLILTTRQLAKRSVYRYLKLKHLLHISAEQCKQEHAMESTCQMKRFCWWHNPSLKEGDLIERTNHSLFSIINEDFRSEITNMVMTTIETPVLSRNIFKRLSSRDETISHKLNRRIQFKTWNDLKNLPVLKFSCSATRRKQPQKEELKANHGETEKITERFEQQTFKPHPVHAGN